MIILCIGNYILTEKGEYYALRARFNYRDFKPKKKVPRGDVIRIYDAWLHNEPNKRKRLMIFETWGNGFTLITLKDKACIDNLFSFNDYDLIKLKKIMEYRS